MSASSTAMASTTSSSSSSSQKRRQGTSLAFPIIYGSKATPVTATTVPVLDHGDTLDPSHTHVWSMYVRSALGADLSWFIDRVQFSLHESYPRPRRTLNKPPYEVRASGWGEFEVPIKIFFVDAAEKPVTIYHHLRLFPVNVSAADTDPERLREDAVVHEHYDEIVFENPTEFMYDLFTKHKGAGALQSAPSGGKRTIIPIAKSASSSSTSTFSTALEQTELRTITAALSKIQEQLVTFKERAGGITGDLELMRAEMETSEMFAGEGEEESDVVAVVVNTDASAGRTSASTAASSDAKRRKKKR